MFKNVEKTTTTGIKNFYPCVLMGKANKDVVPAPNFYWDKISWQICSAKGNKVELLLVFHRHENADGRAICTLDTVTGRVSEFRYQDAKTFDSFNDATNINSLKIFKAKGSDAFKYTVSLTHYFGRVNEAEYEKETVFKKAAFRKDESIEKVDKLVNPTEKGSSYNPDCEKTAYVGSIHETKKPRNYTVESWQRAGYYRHYKSGKAVYIKPTICKPRKNGK